MEIVHCTEDDSLPGLNTLLQIRPFSRKFQARFDSLSTSIHWQNHVITKHLGDSLCKATEDRIVEGTRGQGQFLGLLYQSRYDLWVTMSLTVVF